MDFSKIMNDLKEQEFAEEIKAPRKKIKRLVAAFDCETEKFLYGRTPAPFFWGIKIENGEYYEFWGDNCTQLFINFLKKYPHPLKMFAHNGGKFDFIFLLRAGIFCGEPMLISSRIVEANIIEARSTQHILRDSYAMIPVPLSAYKKDDMDYNKHEPDVREDHKKEILDYLKSDCVYLLELVQKCHESLGDNITVGSAALKQLKKFHPFEKINPADDEKIRPYYKGGRVQCFEQGVVTGKLKVYDVNSMYPCTMKNENHPTNVGAIYLSSFPASAITSTGDLKNYEGCGYFANITGYFTSEFGHFPVRTKSGLTFNQKEGDFEVTHHELICALKHGIFVLEKINRLIVCPNSINFTEFVDKFVSDKIAAQKAGNIAETLFSKLILNSAYGKFGQNPSKFKDFFICEPWEVMEVEAMNQELLQKLLPEEQSIYALSDMEWKALEKSVPPEYFWVLSESSDLYTIYARKPDDISEAYNDCFIAASITGASRALLMDALITCERPIYCDTDSIVCEELGANCVIDSTKLGAWDLEATGDTIYIYGKKVYSLYKDGVPFVDKKGKEKNANKGVRMTSEEIKNLVTGQNLTWSKSKECYVFSYEQDAPSFKLSGETLFLKRELVYKKPVN